MIFSSYRFIFLFFPVVFLGFQLLRRTGRPAWVKLWLVAASLVFYGVGQPDFFLVFLASILFNYGVMTAMDKAGRPWLRVLLLVAAIVENVGLLFYFKYTNFFLENINRFLGTEFPMLLVILPIGISFFTFQILAYTVTFFREECDRPSLLDYMVFVTFFPQLIVGPVVKQEELVPQIRARDFMKPDPVNICRGVELFSVGCAKKILLADPMIDFAAAFYGGDPWAASSPEVWVGVFCYVFAYYFDFSGYIDMARGLGHLFGFDLPLNFDSPYKARDFADFWRRWNMTISRFFYETIFANIFRFGDGFFKLILATLATFLVSGLWHGAGWHFIAWGAVNGALVCVANIRMLKERRPLPAWLGIALTFLIGAVIRVLFDSHGMTQALAIYRRMFDPGQFIYLGTTLSAWGTFVGDHGPLCLLLVFSAVLCFAAPNSNRISEKTAFTARDAVFSGGLLALSLFFMTHVSQFLYFNF